MIFFFNPICNLAALRFLKPAEFISLLFEPFFLFEARAHRNGQSPVALLIPHLFCQSDDAGNRRWSIMRSVTTSSVHNAQLMPRIKGFFSLQALFEGLFKYKSFKSNVRSFAYPRHG